MQRFTKVVEAMMLIVAMFVFAGCNKQEDQDVRVTTYAPQDITQTTAKCGGDVIVTQGLSLDELGVCWSIDRNPTVEDTRLFTTNWSSTYVCTITGLEPSTEYHIRAYALRGLECYYGDDKSFTTEEIGVGGSGIYNGHEYVDLGLPSGTLWATCNVGADIPEDYGDYFAWGETETKSEYNYVNYKYYRSDNVGSGYTKYCSHSYGYNYFTDTLTLLQPMDDAASVNWGDGWCMPTAEQWRELRDNTTLGWTTRNGVNGKLFISTNGNSIFLPASGIYWDDIVNGDLRGNYWSNLLNTDMAKNAWYFSFDIDDYGMYNSIRICGQSVRPVRSTCLK